MTFKANHGQLESKQLYCIFFTSNCLWHLLRILYLQSQRQKDAKLTHVYLHALLAEIFFIEALLITFCLCLQYFIVRGTYSWNVVNVALVGRRIAWPQWQSGVCSIYCRPVVIDSLVWWVILYACHTGAVYRTLCRGVACHAMVGWCILSQGYPWKYTSVLNKKVTRHEILKLKTKCYCILLFLLSFENVHFYSNLNFGPTKINAMLRYKAIMRIKLWRWVWLTTSWKSFYNIFGTFPTYKHSSVRRSL